MKLYVWNEPHRIEYGSTCLYAIAESEDEARAIALTARVSDFGWPPKDNAGVSASDINRPPDRVHDLPYAEVYQWSE